MSPANANVIGSGACGSNRGAGMLPPRGVAVGVGVVPGVTVEAGQSVPSEALSEPLSEALSEAPAGPAGRLGSTPGGAAHPAPRASAPAATYDKNIFARAEISRPDPPWPSMLGG
ncbi:hypothetical protein GCM10009872_34900 [Actinopolymorpha rutila]